MTEFPCTIAFDFKLMRPGCILLQSALGATIENDQLGRFDNWLTHPTDDMRLATLRSQDELDAALAFVQTKEKK